jgi:hypothetical protein
MSNQILPFLPDRPVGDHADVDPRELPHHPRQQRAAKDLHAASLVGRSDEDVGGATLARDSANGLHEIVAFLFEKADAKDAGESMKRGQLRYLLGGRLAAGMSYPERIDLGAPSRCAERRARLRIRCDFGCGSTRASTRARRLLAD